MHFLLERGEVLHCYLCFFTWQKKFILPTREGELSDARWPSPWRRVVYWICRWCGRPKYFEGPRGVLKMFFCTEKWGKKRKKAALMNWISGLRIQETYKNENSRKSMWVGIEDGIGLLAWLLQEVASIHGWQSREAHAFCPNSVYIYNNIPTHLPLCHLESRFMYHTVFFAYFWIDMFLLNLL